MATAKQLSDIIKRKGYGVTDAFGQRSAGAQASDSRSKHNLESNFEHALEGEKGLQVNYTGLPLVRITFYRHRLADHHRSISEKALVDALQYCGAIRGDSERDIRLVVEDQVKVASKDEERTTIEIEYPEVDFDNLFTATGRTDGR